MVLGTGLVIFLARLAKRLYQFRHLTGSLLNSDVTDHRVRNQTFHVGKIHLGQWRLWLVAPGAAGRREDAAWRARDGAGCETPRAQAPAPHAPCSLSAASSGARARRAGRTRPGQASALREQL